MYPELATHSNNLKATNMYVFFLFLCMSVGAICPTNKCVKCTEKIYICTGDIVLTKRDIHATEKLLIMKPHPGLYLMEYCQLDVRVIQAGPLKIACKG